MFWSLSLSLSSYLVHCCSTLFHLPLALALSNGSISNKGYAAPIS